MALQKSPVFFNFSKGIDTKTDKNQLPVGRFLTLVNSVFDVNGQLTKRNGFPLLTTLPNTDQTTLTTFNDNLIATGTDLLSFSAPTNSWINQGTIQPIDLNVKSLLRDSNTQYGEDAAIAENGLVCFVYTNAGDYPYYQISDSNTGAQIVARTLIDQDAFDPRVFILGRYFIITYLIDVAGDYHLQYIAIPITQPDSPRSPVDISTEVDTTFSGYDGFVANNSLYLAWSGTSNTVKLTYMSSTLVVQAAVDVDPMGTAELLSVTADNSQATPTIWVSYWDSGSSNGFITAYSSQLAEILAPTNIIPGATFATGSLTVVNYSGLAGDTCTLDATVLTEGVEWTAATDNDTTAASIASAINTASIGFTATAVGAVVNIVADSAGSAGNVALASSDLTNLSRSGATLTGGTDGITLAALTSIATDGVCSVFYEIDNDYASPYPTSNIRSDYIKTRTATESGTLGTATVLIRSVGLASKPFYDESGTAYMLVAYGERNQPTYFLIDTSANIYAKLAYANGGGYASTQVIPSVSNIDGLYSVPYLIKDFLTTVNKTTNTSLPVNAIYTSTGINLAQFEINTSGQYSNEIASCLHLTGGQVWQYDGVKPVELGFNVWPENIAADTSGSGSVANGTYFYAFTYEWTDNQGNIHRSAPSIPIQVVVAGGPKGVNLYVPTLRLTYKTGTNPVRVVGYRWTASQPIYYQFTAVVPSSAGQGVNDPTVDFITITDSNASSAILGNNILYTTGGVIENISPPACTHSCLYKNRLFLIDAEDPNLLWYSKQVIEGVPVEMSDLFTLYIAPTTGAQGSTGPAKCLSAMDDKLIIFKSDAIYYVTGTGPDNTGASNDFSDPVFITSSVGCSNPASLVLMPNGIMFQSGKGIWLLGRDLSTQYIGSDVEAYNDSLVKKAEVIPGTNQVRFILDNNITLMYDYFYQQWGTFTNIRAVSSTLYSGMHTYLNDFGQVFKEEVGHYLDGSSPVLMSFSTGALSMAGIRGYERFYFMFLLGTYYTPFKLAVNINYDYSSSTSQQIMVTPDNYTANYGNEAVWGSGGPWGGPGNVFQARLFPERQKCQAFSLSVQEIYDPSMGASPGQGLTLSGINAVIGVKKGYSTQKATKSFG